MIIKIFTGPLNYDISQLYSKDVDEYIIGVDQGCSQLLEQSINIDMAIGDFDSINKDIYLDIKSKAKQTIVHDNIKSNTDTYLALEHALAMEHTEIIIYGGLGKRFDHSYANVKLLEKGKIKIINNESMIYVLHPGNYSIDNKYKYISFFSLNEVDDLSLVNFKYELQSINLKTNNPLCISNEGSGIVTFSKGSLLVIHQNE